MAVSVRTEWPRRPQDWRRRCGQSIRRPGWQRAAGPGDAIVRSRSATRCRSSGSFCGSNPFSDCAMAAAVAWYGRRPVQKREEPRNHTGILEAANCANGVWRRLEPVRNGKRASFPARSDSAFRSLAGIGCRRAAGAASSTAARQPVAGQQYRQEDEGDEAKHHRGDRSGLAGITPTSARQVQRIRDRHVGDVPSAARWAARRGWTNPCKTASGAYRHARPPRRGAPDRSGRRRSRTAPGPPRSPLPP